MTIAHTESLIRTALQLEIQKAVPVISLSLSRSKLSITGMAELPLATRLKLRMLTLVRHLGRIDRRILSLIDTKTPAPATKLINTTTISTSDIAVDPSRYLWFRLFSPSISDKPLPLIVYFHGGGFSLYGPDSKTFDNLCSHLAAKTPAVVASVNYRLAPANTDLSKCFIGGDSAGGNIAHHVTVKVLQSSDNFDELRIAGVVEVQPFYGGEERTESELRLTNSPFINVDRTDLYWRNFLPDGADRNHPAAHVVGGGDAEMKGLDFPRCLVIVGGYDP